MEKKNLSSLVSMPLLVKVMVLKWTLVIISSMVTLTVQTLESMRTEHTSCSSLSRRIRLSVSLATPSQELPSMPIALTVDSALVE